MCHAVDSHVGGVDSHEDVVFEFDSPMISMERLLIIANCCYKCASDDVLPESSSYRVGLTHCCSLTGRIRITATGCENGSVDSEIVQFVRDIRRRRSAVQNSYAWSRRCW